MSSNVYLIQIRLSVIEVEDVILKRPRIILTIRYPIPNIFIRSSVR